MKNRVTKILNTFYPVMQGPMRSITLGEMAAAVSNSGGFGQIAASGLSGDRLREELKRAGELTCRPIGVNIPIYRPNASEALEIAIDMGIKTVTTSAGDPAKMIDRIKEAGLTVLHKVSTVDMALRAQGAGVDAVIAMGFEAGGHVGRAGITTLCLVPQLVDVLKIPVVAAGGIADAKGLVAAFALGAEGVEMGTRFLATRECQTQDFYKDMIINAKSDSTLLLGEKAMPIRVLRNKAAESIINLSKAGENEKAQAESDKRYIRSEADPDSAIMPAGQIAGLIKDIEEVSELIPRMFNEASTFSNQLNIFFQEKDR